MSGQEKERTKTGESASDIRPDDPAKAARKDTNARWTVKYSKAGKTKDSKEDAGLDPDIRIQEAIRLIFQRFQELGSARQTLLALTREGLHFPRPSDGHRSVTAT